MKKESTITAALWQSLDSMPDDFTSNQFTQSAREIRADVSSGDIRGFLLFATINQTPKTWSKKIVSGSDSQSLERAARMLVESGRYRVMRRVAEWVEINSKSHE